LAFHYYNGLAERIKDGIVMARGRDLPYSQLRALAQDLDNKYWQREDEKSQLRKTSDSSASKPKPASTSTTTTSRTSTSTPSASRTTQQTTTTRQSSSSTPSKRKDLTGKLDGNNKLTDAEQQRRMAENLCMYCGNTGHKAADCRLAAANKNAAKNVKGRAADTEAASDTSASISEVASDDSGKE